MVATTAVQVSKERVAESAEKFLRIPLRDITADANIREVKQTDAKVKELADSIKQLGVREPVLVRPFMPSGYQLVSGHRRLVAAKMAGLNEIPALSREMTDAEMREVQLIENIQREDLSEIDEAKAYKAYLEATKSTQAQLGEKVGKSQPYIANRLRLLELRPDVQDRIRRGMISASHGEQLLKIPAEMAGVQGSLAKGVEVRKLTVEQLKWEVDNAVTAHKRKAAFEKELSKFEFKICPTKDCGKRANSVETWSGPNVLGCPHFHRWDGKTGKPPARETRSTGSYKAPAPPPPPDITESLLIRSVHDVKDLLEGVLKNIGPEDISYIDIGGAGYDGDVVLVLRGSGKHRPKLPCFTAATNAYSTGERAIVLVEGSKSAARKASKAKFRQWAARNLPKRSPARITKRPVNTSAAGLGQPEAINAIRKAKDLEEIEAIRAAELKGKKRHSVLAEIDAAIADICTDGRGFGY